MSTTNKALGATLALLAIALASCAHSSSGLPDPECSITAEFAADGNANLEMRLIAAAAGGDAKAVVASLDGGANPNFSDSELMTPLAWAARCGNIEVVKALVARGADVNLSVTYQKGMQYRFKDSSALIWAASNEHVEVVRFLIEKSADSRRKEKVFEVVEGQDAERFVSEGRSAFDVTKNKEVISLLKKTTK